MPTLRSPRPHRIAIALVCLVVLAACGSDDGEAEGASTTDADAAAAFPVTVEHKYGDTTVEEVPTRIVTVGLTEQDVLLALGIVPVGTTEWFGEHDGAIWPWAEDELDALDGEPPVVVGDATAVNFEKVAAQRPDLILAIYSGLTQEDYDKLSAIAPTVAQPADHVDYGVPWEELTRTVGTVVGQADAADALVTDVEGRFADATAARPEFEGASALMATPYEGTYVYGPEDARGRFLTALGFELPPDLVEVTGEEYGGNLSAERADLLDVDVIVWLDAADSDGPLGGPVYETLRVHTEAREVHLNSFDDPLGGATSFVSVLSLPFLLDGIVPRLAAAVDGDPATEVPVS
jgi:iron complex transport system substrate-binding protein